jgi:hypothetical protein
MDRKELNMILKEGEGYKIEFKEGSTTGFKFRLTSVNSGHSEFVRVRISSLLMHLFAPAHERAPPVVHLRSSRAGA